MQRLLPFLLGLLLLLPGCSTSRGTTFERIAEADRAGQPEQTESEQSDAATEEEQLSVGLSIESDPSEAEVYLNNRLVGTTPVTLADLEYGTYKLTLKKEGCYDHEQWLHYEENTKTLEIELAWIMGSISINVHPADAYISLGTGTADPGVTETPIGTYNFLVRAFGYEDSQTSVTIEENEVTYVDVTLEDARFHIYDVALEKKAFSPLNPGMLGEAVLGFKASGPGSGDITISDEHGAIVYRADLPDFSTWNQTFRWNGRTNDGELLPDGTYSIRLDAQGERAGPREYVEISLTLDTRLTIAYRSLWNGVSGLLYSPTPQVLPFDSVQLASIMLGHWENIAGEPVFRAPLALSMRIGLGTDMEVDALAAVILEDVSVAPAFLSGAFKFRYLSVGRLVAFQGAVTAKATYHTGTGTDTFSNFTGLSVGAPLGLRLGPAELVLAPELIVSPWQVTYDRTYDRDPGVYLWLYLRSGLLFDVGPFTSGLSLALRTHPLSGGLRIDLPFQSAFEAHLMLPDTQFLLSFVLAAEIESITQWYLMAGGGFGFIY